MNNEEKQKVMNEYTDERALEMIDAVIDLAQVLMKYGPYDDRFGISLWISSIKSYRKFIVKTIAEQNNPTPEPEPEPRNIKDAIRMHFKTRFNKDSFAETMGNGAIEKVADVYGKLGFFRRLLVEGKLKETTLPALEYAYKYSVACPEEEL